MSNLVSSELIESLKQVYSNRGKEIVIFKYSSGELLEQTVWEVVPGIKWLSNYVTLDTECYICNWF